MTFGIFLAALVLTGAIGFFAYYFSSLRPRAGTLDWITLTEREPLTFARRRHPMARKDALPVLLITLIYAVTAFFQLGSMKAPQTYYDFSSGEMYTIQLDGDPIPASRIWAYSSLGTGSYNLEVSADGEHWSTLTSRTEKDQWDRDITIYYWSEDAHNTFALSQDYIQLFKWQDIVPENAQLAQYIRVTGRADSGQQTLRLGKLLFLDDQGQPISFHWNTADNIPTPDSLSSVFAVDDTIPAAISWRNSSYFDEIYHPRTALEHIENLHPYEITHPPLGKVILGLGIRLFGMTPFGWRFMGTLFGVLMLPLLYIFLKNMFGKTVVAACGTTLFAAEFMHLTQTRIATIDTYGVFFILLSYFFFYRWLTASATPNKKGKTGEGYGSLALSGITWGIGCACKWTVIYAGVGLALMYLIHIILRIRAWKKAEEEQEQAQAQPAPYPAPDPLDLDTPFTFTPAPVPVRVRKKSLAGWLTKTLLLSVLCFVILPTVIYTASYIPYAASKGSVTFASVFDEMWRNQSYMLNYHKGVDTPHAYSSRWYQWIVDGRPILYYLQDMGGGMTERFAAFNNPLISWAGLLSLIAVTIRLFQRRCGKALFLVLSFLAQLLPWVFITRTTFAYHYFPSILFLVFCICYLFNDLMECKWAKWRLPVYGLTTASAALYALFYPALIGLTMPLWYSNGLLRFLPSWPF